MKLLKRWVKVSLSVLGGLVAALTGLILYARSLPPAHEHCIQAAAMALARYASEHGGKYPTHTNGFGDALALLVAQEYDDGSHLVGVDDDASWLRAAATNKTDVPEELCTRIYVQGLEESKNDLAVLFDRYAVRGGDHLRGRWGQPYLREVVRGGLMTKVSLDYWPAFASNQVELLVKEGIPRTTAESYYRPTLDPKAVK